MNRKTYLEVNGSEYVYAGNYQNILINLLKELAQKVCFLTMLTGKNLLQYKKRNLGCF